MTKGSVRQIDEAFRCWHTNFSSIRSRPTASAEGATVRDISRNLTGAESARLSAPVMNCGASLLAQQEPVNHVVRVVGKSRHSPVWSNAESIGALAGTRARARNVELNEGATVIAHEAMIHICLVHIPSRDRSIRIDSKRVGALQRTWDSASVGSIERHEAAISISQEAV